MSKKITAQVVTENGLRYATQLCKHWSHKLEVEPDAAGGIVRFPDAIVRLEGSAKALSISVEAADRAKCEHIADVVEKHIDRFAFRESALAYDWQDA